MTIGRNAGFKETYKSFMGRQIFSKSSFQFAENFLLKDFNGQIRLTTTVTKSWVKEYEIRYSLFPKKLFYPSLKCRFYPDLIHPYSLTQDVVFAWVFHNQVHDFIHSLSWPFGVVSSLYHLHILVLPFEIFIKLLTMFLIYQCIFFSPNKYDCCRRWYIFYIILNAQILQVKISFLLDIWL